MSNIEILKNEIFKIPQDRGKHNVIDFLEQRYNKFFELTQNLNGKTKEEFEQHKKSLKDLCDSIINSLREYYRGFPSKSYEEFKRGIDDYSQSLLIHKKGGGVINLYRARLGEQYIFSREQMFHVPFEERYKLTTQRYSIPGLPCLYLSNYSYLCWEELGRPQLNKLQISRFEIDTSKINFLDLSLNIDFALGFHEVVVGSDESSEKIDGLDPEQFFLFALTSWPLVIACSIKVSNPLSAFKPEYVIPQNLFQWVRSNKNVDGIKYRSTKNLSYKSVWGPKLINYAIPVRDVNKDGYCKYLAERINLTAPINLDFIDVTCPKISDADKKAMVKKQARGTTDYMPIFEFELLNGIKQKYIDTKFGLIEVLLSKLTAEKLVNLQHKI